MALTYSLTVADSDLGPIQIDLKGYQSGYSHEDGGALKYAPLAALFKLDQNDAALVALLKAFGRSERLDTLTIEVKDGSNIVERVTLTNAGIAELDVTSDTTGAAGRVEFVFSKILVEAATTPGTLDVQHEAGAPDASVGFLPNPSAPSHGPVSSGGDFKYKLLVDGRTIDLAGYQLGLDQPLSSTGAPSGARKSSPLLVHLDEKAADGATDWLLHSAFNNADLAEARIEVRNASDQLVHTIVLTETRAQAQANANGLGASRSVVALTYDSLEFGIFTTPGGTTPDQTVALGSNSDPDPLSVLPMTLAEIASRAQVQPGGSMTLTFATTAGGPIAGIDPVTIKGLEFDYSSNPTRAFGPLIVHVGGEPTSAALVRLLDALQRNAEFGTATITFKDEADVVVKTLTLTKTIVVAQSMAGGGGGGDAALALGYEQLELATATTPGGSLDQIRHFAGAGDPSLLVLAGDTDLRPLATVTAGGGYKYTLTVNGLEVSLSGYELDVAKPTNGSQAAGAAGFSALLVHVRGQDEAAELTSLIAAAEHNDALGDAVLNIRDVTDNLVGRITLHGTAVGASALAVGTGRAEATLALTYSRIEMEDWDGAASTSSFDFTLNENQTPGNLAITDDEFREIANGAGVRTGSGSEITLKFKRDGVETEVKIDGFELDLVRSSSARFSPLVVHIGGEPGQDGLLKILDAFGHEAPLTDFVIEVRKGGELTQSLALVNARVRGQSLAAGGHGSDAAVAFVFDQIELLGKTTEGGPLERTFQTSDPHFTGVKPALADLARVRSDNDYSYQLTFGDKSVSLSGYELDLTQGFGDNGSPSGRIESKPVILHFDQHSDTVDLVELFRAADSNDPIASAVIEVKNADGEVVHKLALTNASVQVAATEGGVSNSATALALKYDTFDYQRWDPDAPASADPQPAASTQFNSSTDGGNVAVLPISHAELAAEVHAITPGFVERLIDEVHDFFDFIRNDLPQRALGLVTPASSSLAPVDGFSALDSGLPGLPSLSDIPIIGDKLIPIVQQGLDIFHDVEDRIVEALNNLPDSEDAAATLAQKINELGIDGLSAEVEGAAVRLTFSASDMISLALDDIAVSLGTDRFGLDLLADVGAKITAALNLSALVDVETGAIEILDTGGEEMILDLSAGADFHASGGLGFLDITATDNNPGNDEINLRFGLDLPTGRVQDIALDAVNLSIDGSASLNVHVVTATPVSFLPTIASDLVVTWDPQAPGEGLLREIAFNDVTLDLRSLLETLAEVFKPIIDIYDTFPIGTILDAVTAPLPIIDTLARKVGITSLFDVVPLEHPDGLLNLLDVAVLVMKADGVPDSDPRIKGISLFAEAIAAINSGNGSSLDDLGLIELGSYRFVDPDASGSSLTARAFGDGPMTLGATSSNPFEKTQDASDPRTPEQQAEDKIRDSDAFKNGVLGEGGISVLGPSPFASGFKDVTGFSIPLLENGGENVIKILFNAALPDDPVTIIQYDLPALQFSEFYEQFFPVVGPIGAVLRGGFSGRIDFAIGYDTAGLARGGLSDFLEGFYITTNEFSPGSGLYDPVATLQAGIEAFGAISIGVAAAGVGGGVLGEISAFLDDEAGDGKLRLADAGDCIFDPISGKVIAQLSAFIKVGWGPFSWTRKFKIADATLLDFAFGCDGPDPDEMGGLATLGPDGHHTAGPDGVAVAASALQLNVGYDRAELRHSIVPDYAKDLAEHYAIRRAVAADGTIIPGALDVAAYTQIETFGSSAAPVTVIYGSFGADDDSIVIDADVLTPSDISGDAGNDLLSGGGGDDTLYGDEREGGGNGEDILNGNGGNDRLFGGKGDDVLDGGAGADLLDGGDGLDQVTYENSPVGVIFRPIAPINGQFASRGEGGDAEGDTLISIEYIIGSHFNDQFYGNPNAGNILEGLEGNDFLSGGSKDDFILGGPGADRIIGLANTSDAEGGDRTSYLTSNGGVRVDLVTGQGKGGDAEGDLLVSMEHVQGSVFDDALRGSAAANRLDGLFGDDILEGRGGADIITAGEGDDIIYALGDGDTIDGGSGRDLLSYVNRTSGPVTVNLVNGTGTGGDKIALEPVPEPGLSTIEDLDGTDLAGPGDNLTGDREANRIRGLAGNDRLAADAGQDTLIGGAGADTLIGGQGRDLADYLDSPGAVTVNLQTGQGFGADAEGDILSEIEDLRGSDFTDFLTGNAGANRIDPALARGAGFLGDIVAGGGGIDTLVLDYSRGDTGKGLVAGYNMGSAFEGSFQREQLVGTALLDKGGFLEIERLEIIGTFKDDTIYGGGGADKIITGSGNDTIYGGGKGVYPPIEGGRLGTAIGGDYIRAGDGDDTVLYGTNENRVLARDIRLDFGQDGFDPFLLDGGRGIDTLSISLQHLSMDVVLEGAAPGKEKHGANMILPDGSYIGNFEILGSVYTGSGFDRITQLGNYNNAFDTGAGADIITPGLGRDIVLGGTDFVSNFDGGLYIDFEQNPGDLLILDYSSLEGTGVTGSIGSKLSSLSGVVPQLNGLMVNTGTFYQGDTLIMLFDEIERMHVTGTELNDVLQGTQNFAQDRAGRGNFNLPQADSSDTLRGADILIGLGGNDIIIGNTGSDVLDGGDGNDILVGTDLTRLPNLDGNIAYPGGEVDQTEVDVLTGGAGADRFYLGLSNGFFYSSTRQGRYVNDVFVPAVDENRAIITDFNQAEGDRLYLYGNAGNYSFEVIDSEDPGVGSTTNLYFEQPNGVSQWIAELWGVDGLDLHGPGVVYLSGSGLLADSAAFALPEMEESLAARIFATESLEDAGDEPVALTAATDWITQDNDPASLRNVLLNAISGSAIDPASLTIQLNGNGEAFGRFDGDPFGLGSGFILSTGKVVDLQGANLEDGRGAREHFAEIEFVKIGRTSSDTTIGTDIYRADLSGLGFDLASITLPDSNSRFGGSGGAVSGFDLDNILLSRTLIGPFSPGSVDFNNQAALDVFDFSAGGIVYRPGDMRFTSADDFEGTHNGIIVNPGQLGVQDGYQVGSDYSGFLSLGDGGEIAFNLTETVSTEGPLYLYVGEYGGSGETVTSRIRASDKRIDAVADLSTDFNEDGEGGDTTSMTFSFDRLAGSSDDMIVFNFVVFTEELAEFAGSAFNDVVKIKLNGENLAELSGGYALTVNNLLPSALGPAHPDLILNPVGTGPLADQVRADAYTKTLTFAGLLKAHNTITIEVKDIGDGALDTGVLVRAGTASSGGVGGWGTLDLNDAPVFSNLNGAVIYDSGVTPVLMDGSVQVFDAELAASGNYAGASLTLSRLGGADARDMFGATGPISFSAGNIFYSGAPGAIGTVENMGGVLTIHFNANATQTAVNAVLSSLTYSSTSPVSETVDVLWDFSDGNAGAQGLGGPLSTIGTTSIEVRAEDYIYGTPQNDTMTGTGADEKFRALAGNDIIRGEGGNDRIEAGDGNDVLYGGTGINLLYGEAGNDNFGNETVAARNLFDGGEGVDTLTTRAAAGQTVIVDLVAGTVTGGYYDGSTVTGVENVKNGTTGNSVTYIGDGEDNALTGGMAADILRGGGGNDTLQGSLGNDIIDGGVGADLLTGGAGNDIFVLRKGEVDGDRLTDFLGNAHGTADVLELSGFGPGASITSAGNIFTIHYTGGSESFTLNTAALNPADYMFV